MVRELVFERYSRQTKDLHKTLLRKGGFWRTICRNTSFYVLCFSFFVWKRTKPKRSIRNSTSFRMQEKTRWMDAEFANGRQKNTQKACVSLVGDFLRGGFKYLFMFIPIRWNDPNWLVFLRWVAQPLTRFFQILNEPMGWTSPLNSPPFGRPKLKLGFGEMDG